MKRRLAELGHGSDELIGRGDKLSQRGRELRGRADELRERSATLRSAIIRRINRPQWILVSVLAPCVFWPWLTLRGQPVTATPFFVVQLGFGILLPTIWVYLHLRAMSGQQAFPAIPIPVLAIRVIEQAVLIEGTFAQMYYAMAHREPKSFNPPDMSGIDAAYFTISTATTTGMGDIHPISGDARLLVSGQMIASLYVVVIAITTAAQRMISHGWEKRADGSRATATVASRFSGRASRAWQRLKSKWW